MADDEVDGAEEFREAVARLKRQTRELADDGPRRRVLDRQDPETDQAGAHPDASGDPFRDRRRSPLPRQTEQQRRGDAQEHGESLAEAMERYRGVAEDDEDEVETEPEHVGPEDLADEDPADRTRKRLVRLGVAVVVVTLFSPLTPAALPVQPVAVGSDAMEPQVPERSLAVAVEGMSIAEGDLVAYETPEGTTKIRRVADVQDAAEPTTYTVEAVNDQGGETQIDASQVVGEVPYHVPMAGFVWLLPKALVGLTIVTMLGAYAAIVAIDAAGDDDATDDEAAPADAQPD